MVLAIGLNGCATQHVPETKAKNDQQLVECASPRPEVCAEIFQPVCAAVDTGVRCIKSPCPSTEYKTFPNACHACRNVKTSGYYADECDAQKQPRENR